LHADQAQQPIGKILQILSAPKLWPDKHIALGIDSVNLKYLLRQANADSHSVLQRGSSPRGGSTATSLRS